MTFCVAIADKITGKGRQILFEGLPPQTQDLHGFFIRIRKEKPRRMLTSIHTFVVDYCVGDYASIVGLVLSLLGFSVTIFATLKSRSAAKLAQSAAEATRDALTRFETVAKVTGLINAMSEIKRLQRIEAWQILPDRYALIRQELVLLRNANPGFSQDHRTSLQGAISQFSELESVVETFLSYPKRNAPKASKLNAIVSAQIDKLNEIQDTLRQQVISNNA